MGPENDALQVVFEQTEVSGLQKALNFTDFAPGSQGGFDTGIDRGRGDGVRRDDEEAGERGEIRKLGQPLPDPLSQAEAPFEKKGDIGSKASRQGRQLGRTEAEAPQSVEAQERRRRVRAPAAEAAAGRDALPGGDPDPGGGPGPILEQPGGPVDEVRPVPGHRRIVAAELENAGRGRLELELIGQRDRLEEGPDVVITVGPFADDLDREVDLGERPDGHLSRSSRISSQVFAVKRERNVTSKASAAG